MASSITSTDFIATISEQVTLNGQPINSENQLTVEDVNNVDKRIMTLPEGSEVTIVQFASAVAAGTFVRGDMRYLRITNKDTVNYARIRMKKNGADAMDLRLNAGGSFMLNNAKLSVSETAASFTAFQDADSVSGQAYDGDIDIEYSVASIE